MDVEERWRLPEWCEEVRDHQVDAVDQIVDLYRRGCRMVVLDAPTGTGKTLIAELVRQELATENLYVCSDKGLQGQYLGDFPESRVLKGRANYLPVRRIKAGGEEITCDDCTGKNCPYCPTPGECPYIKARGEALGATTAVLNSSYYLTELNGPGRFAGRGLATFDEADTLEGVLARTAAVSVTVGRVKKLGIRMPLARAHYRTVVSWVERELLPATVDQARQTGDMKEKQGWLRFGAAWKRFADSWKAGEPWVRDVESGTLRFRPVMVAGFGERMVWQHALRFLLMSATVLDAQNLAGWLGWGHPVESVQVGMTFPVENRWVNVLPTVDMSRRGKQAGTWGDMVTAVVNVIARHPGESVLVHSHSYELTKLIANGLALTYHGSRPVLTYLKAADKDVAVDSFRALKGEGPVLVAPSLGRGVDLPDDLCRVVIVAKLPYASLGDKQIAARLNDTDDGQLWYTTQAVRELVQMTGRGVRSKDDWCESYVLDQGISGLLKKAAWLFPDWWRDAMRTPFNPDDLLVSSG